VAYGNKILIGSTIDERIALLDMLYPQVGLITVGNLAVLLKTSIPDIYRAASYHSNFESIYGTISKADMVEGFVLKRKNGKLENMTRELNNNGWAVKVRKPTRGYTH
jgi:hypothetical protein